MQLLKKKVTLPKWIKAIDELPRIRIYRLKGEIDALAVTVLQKFAALARNQEGYEFKHILLDMAEVTLIDSSAVAALLTELNHYGKRFQKLALMNLRGEPQDMIRLAKVGHLFPSYDNEVQAIRELQTRF